MHNKLIPIAKQLICEVETQMEDLENVCAKELGEVIDMIKDLSEAIYYDVVTEAMLEVDELGEEDAKISKRITEKKHYHTDTALLIKDLEAYMKNFTEELMEVSKHTTPEEK